MHIKKFNIKNQVCNCYFNKSIKKKKNLDSINILIDEKKQKDLVMYYTRYGDNKSIIRLHYHKFKGKIQKHEETNISHVSLLYARYNIRQE